MYASPLNDVTFFCCCYLGKVIRAGIRGVKVHVWQYNRREGRGVGCTPHQEKGTSHQEDGTSQCSRYARVQGARPNALQRL